jgi:hypothetical protein
MVSLFISLHKFNIQLQIRLHHYLYIPIVKIYEPLLRKLALPNIFYTGIILFSKMAQFYVVFGITSSHIKPEKNVSQITKKRFYLQQNGKEYKLT